MLIQFRRFLVVAGPDAFDFGHDPNLQKMERLRPGWVVFAVRYSGAGTHVLNFSRPNHRTRSHAVLVRDCSFKNIGDDFHVAMRMSGKALSWSHAVFIDNAEM